MIGLIFGESDFPIVILKKIKKKNLKHLVIDLTKAKRFKREKNSYSVSIGQFGKIIRLLKNNKCKKVLFAGNVKKPSLSKIKLDLKGIELSLLFKKLRQWYTQCAYMTSNIQAMLKIIFFLNTTY